MEFRADSENLTKHYYTGPPPVPSVVGSDGLGRREDARLVYFDATVAPFGPMAKRTLAREDSLIAVPDGADPVMAAARGKSGLAAYAGLHWRDALRPGETVLVLGATGVVGRLAVQVARLLGAGRVMAAGRDADGLATPSWARTPQCSSTRLPTFRGGGRCRCHLSPAVERAGSGGTHATRAGRSPGPDRPARRRRSSAGGPARA